MNYERRVYVPSLSSISPNRLSGTRICEDIAWEFDSLKLQYWVMLLEKRYLFCSSNFIVPSIILTCHSLSPLTCLPSSVHVPEWHVLAEILLPVSLENSVAYSFFHFETYPVTRYILYFRIVYKQWAEKKVLERLEIFRNRRKIRKAPSLLPNILHFCQEAGL